MKLCFVLLTMFTFFTDSAFTQTDTLIRFLNQTYEEVPENQSRYKSICITRKMEDGNWSVKDFYFETGKIMVNAYFTDSNLSLRAGPYDVYHKNGKLQMKGNYVKNKKQGIWREWHDDGNISDSMIYDMNGNLTGVRKQWDSDGRIRDSAVYESGGKGWLVNWHNNGVKRSEGAMINHEKTGKWKFFRKTGTLSAEEEYIKDSAVSIVCFNEEGTPSREECVVEKDADFPKGIEAWQRYIIKNVIAFQDELNKKATPGTVYVLFVIGTDGKIVEAKIENPQGGYLEEFALNTIRRAPRWIPARQHNMPVLAYRKQPISFEYTEE